jgi:hypothetical protein
MIACDVRNHLKIRAEDSREPTVPYEVITVLVMLVIVDDVPNVLEPRSCFKKFTVSWSKLEW